MTTKNKRFSLSPEELKRFHQQGYLDPFKVYEPDEIKKAWRRQRLQMMDRSAAIYSDEEAESGVTDLANYDRHLDQEFLAEHIMRPEIVDRVASILGPDVLCWRSEFFPKYPGDEGTDWHQADTFENASGTPQILWPRHADFGGTITAWCAFTDVSVETAALQFIPGTHRTMFYDESKGMHYDPARVNVVEKGEVKRGFFGYDYRELQIDSDWEPDESAAVSMEMPAGHCILFWSTLMHASHPHLGLTKRMRLGFVARYVPTAVRVYPGTDVIEEYGGRVSLERYGAVLVSGETDSNHNRLATQTTRGYPFRARVPATAAGAP